MEFNTHYLMNWSLIKMFQLSQSQYHLMVIQDTFLYGNTIKALCFQQQQYWLNSLEPSLICKFQESWNVHFNWNTLTLHHHSNALSFFHQNHQQINIKKFMLYSWKLLTIWSNELRFWCWMVMYKWSLHAANLMLPAHTNQNTLKIKETWMTNLPLLHNWWREESYHGKQPTFVLTSLERCNPYQNTHNFYMGSWHLCLSNAPSWHKK